MEPDNRFVASIHEMFSYVLDHAVNNSYIVCVPVATSLVEKDITRHFVSKDYSVDHMLKPSAFVDGLFQSLSGRNVLIKAEDITTHTGYVNKFTVRILAEENAHGSRGLVYKQLLISGTLDDIPKRVELLPSEPIYKFYTSKEYIGFLHCAVEDSEAAVMYADAFIANFNNSYIIFKEFAKECYTKVKTALQDLHKVSFIQICKGIPQFEKVLNDAKYSSYLIELVESNLLYKTYDKLFENIVIFLEDEQNTFEEQARKVYQISSASEIGVDSALAEFDFMKSMQLIETLENLKTPWEKLHVLTQLPNVMCKEIKIYLNKTDFDKAESWEMSADQYFPLCTWFLAKVHPRNIIAHLTFMSEFSLSTARASQEQYHLTNLLSAVQTIRHLSTSPPQLTVDWSIDYGKYTLS